jgi:hypothetical protein
MAQCSSIYSVLSAQGTAPDPQLCSDQGKGHLSASVLLSLTSFSFLCPHPLLAVRSFAASGMGRSTLAPHSPWFVPPGAARVQALGLPPNASELGDTQSTEFCPGSGRAEEPTYSACWFQCLYTLAVHFSLREETVEILWYRESVLEPSVLTVSKHTEACSYQW